MTSACLVVLFLGVRRLGGFAEVTVYEVSSRPAGSEDRALHVSTFVADA